MFLLLLACLGLAPADRDPEAARLNPLPAATPTLGFPAPLQQFLEDGRWDRSPTAFRIIALSNFAEACVHPAVSDPALLPEARRCTQVLARRAKELVPTEKLSDNNLSYTHLLIVLSACERLSPGEAACDPTLAGRLALHLRKRSLAHPTGNAQSYTRDSSRLPADQSATLYALWLQDQLHQSDLHREPLQRWMSWVSNKGTDLNRALPVSELTGVSRTSRLPRGCALSWSVRYMAAFAPKEASKIWSRYKLLYYMDIYALVGFREWPLGVEGPQDDDSGPIIQGVGTAATAFAIGASRAVGDTVTHQRLRATAGMIDAAVQAEGGALADTAQSLLALAIRQNGETLVPWFGQ